MNELLPLLGLAIIAAFCAGLLYKNAPVFALLLSFSAGLAILARISRLLQSITAWLNALAGQGSEEALQCLARCAGILLLTDYARLLCEEAGVESLAWCISLAGRVLVLTALWPLLEEVCGLIWELTG